MAAAKETAEEQLLRMIEGPGPDSSKGPWQRFAPKRWLEQLRGSGEALRRLALPSARDSGDVFLWRLHLAERLSWVVLTLLGVYLIVDLVVVRRQPPTVIVHTGSEAQPTGPLPNPMLAEDQLKPLPAYQEAITARNPFTGRRADSTEAIVIPGVKGKLTELTKTLSVVGVNRGRIPEALIEDSAASHTYFVKVGDQINGVTVKSIDDAGVTLTYEGEETVLQ